MDTRVPALRVLSSLRLHTLLRLNHPRLALSETEANCAAAAALARRRNFFSLIPGSQKSDCAPCSATRLHSFCFDRAEARNAVGSRRLSLHAATACQAQRISRFHAGRAVVRHHRRQWRRGACQGAAAWPVERRTGHRSGCAGSRPRRMDLHEQCRACRRALPERAPDGRRAGICGERRCKARPPGFRRCAQPGHSGQRRRPAGALRFLHAGDRQPRAGLRRDRHGRRGAGARRR